MIDETLLSEQQFIDVTKLTDDEHYELQQLGMLDDNDILKTCPYPILHENRPPIVKKAVHAPQVLNEAYHYDRPSSFSRALTIDIAGYKMLLISGTASVGENGETVYVGDFRAQTWRTYRNISNILREEEMSWHDVVRTTCYLRDIERDYKDFNEVRTAFYSWLGLEPLPASTGIQVRLCRDDLLVEIEAIAICPPQ